MAKEGVGSDARREEAARLMERFTERTGVLSGDPVRYLWTDAFAVCNFLGLAHGARGADGERYTDLALRLIDQVHHTLGRHRLDEPRAGWLSGLAPLEGEAHPTLGGLRIGKRLPERAEGGILDEELEWDRDGQYLHYLTQWMHALDQAARATREPRFNLRARELAATAYKAFSYAPPAGRPRLVWKMSIDLSRPLVTSMGQHDALDGFVACSQLRATAGQLDAAPAEPTLQAELSGFASMAELGSWATVDPLGIGGLLLDACRLGQLVAAGTSADAADLLHGLLAAARQGLRHFAIHNDLRASALQRLAFRELGLAIGLQGIGLLGDCVTRDPGLRPLLEGLRPFVVFRQAIEDFWLDPTHRQVAAWIQRRDINEVMLATSLLPEGYLVLHREIGP